MNVDMLTGLGAREDLRQALNRMTTKNETVAVATFDLDNFMEINQELGTEAGDRVLQTVAALLQQEAEESQGTAFRLSGDEFALLVPGVALELLFLRMEAFRKRVESATERFALPNARSVTRTVGVAQFPRDARNASGLLHAAEAAMASAKESGRNAVALPPSEEMVMKSCYYPSGTVRKLKALSERRGHKESVLLREALTDLIAKYDVLSTG